MCKCPNSMNNGENIFKGTILGVIWLGNMWRWKPDDRIKTILQWQVEWRRKRSRPIYKSWNKVKDDELQKIGWKWQIAEKKVGNKNSTLYKLSKLIYSRILIERALENSGKWQSNINFWMDVYSTNRFKL